MVTVVVVTEVVTGVEAVMVRVEAAVLVTKVVVTTSASLRQPADFGYWVGEMTTWPPETLILHVVVATLRAARGLGSSAPSSSSLQCLLRFSEKE